MHGLTCHLAVRSLQSPCPTQYSTFYTFPRRPKHLVNHQTYQLNHRPTKLPLGEIQAYEHASHLTHNLRLRPHQTNFPFCLSEPFPPIPFFIFNPIYSLQTTFYLKPCLPRRKVPQTPTTPSIFPMAV